MKTKKIIVDILMILPLAATLLALLFLPEQIPAHYDFNNQVTRWGSKYESLIFPVFSILLGIFMKGMARLSARQEENGRNNENVILITAMAVLVLYNGMTGYYLYTSFHKVEDLSAVPVDISQLLFGILGAAMIITGNVMPKLRMNSIIGLRTKWSMKNETTWKKSQRFGGITFILAGIIILAVCCFTKGTACILWSLGIMLAAVIADVYYTYKTAQKY